MTNTMTEINTEEEKDCFSLWTSLSLREVSTGTQARAWSRENEGNVRDERDCFTLWTSLSKREVGTGTQARAWSRNNEGYAAGCFAHRHMLSCLLYSDQGNLPRNHCSLSRGPSPQLTIQRTQHRRVHRTI